MLRTLRTFSGQLSRMVSLPPRKISTSVASSRQDISPYQVLVQMGFPRKRVLKALAATGNRSVQLASDWLLTHVNDAALDSEEPREYILYVTPTGQLLSQIQEFREKAKSICGWNGAHNAPPHITIVPFFKASDEGSLNLAVAVKHAVEKVGPQPACPMKLETYVSPNFIGLFISEEYAEYFKALSLQYVKEIQVEVGKLFKQRAMAGLDCSKNVMPMSKNLDPLVKSLHMTLAYHFDISAFDSLKCLASQLELPDIANWELRLYSRDPRYNNYQVYKVNQGYTPKASDELELVIGDFIYIEESQFDGSADGWVYGTSWLTGISGFLPGIYVQRTAESDAWTLHRAVSLGHKNCAECKSSDSETNTYSVMSNYPHEDAAGLAQEKSEETYQEWEKYWHEVQNDRSESILRITQGTSIDWKSSVGRGIGDSESSDSITTSTGTDSNSRRWVFAMRHGERVDLTYGQWVPFCFDDNGTYVRKDLNMPLHLPEREGGSASFAKDTPLTRVGRLQARLVGEGLRLAGVHVAHVYASAALRCVETAHSFLEGLQPETPVKIKVEPGLFEFKHWYMPGGMAPFMTPKELHKAGYNVDLKYKPYVEVDTEVSETLEQFYKRNEMVIHSAVKDTAADGGNIIFIGHAATLDLMVYALNQFGKKRAESGYQISKNLLRVPYCALGAMRDKPWQVVSPPCPPSINSSSGRFDWKILLDV
ncbi:PREDICTED: protein UBASH3A homolog isoform X1 [Papilio polytes]|uniref:protein UBASH3A homolog isoform X1 n=1 Tax=Papilio polytes TaxID=76194 RepID=UPI000676B05A|nr:PREDICTED: protein UBASH3A homolog isoform X1 [Papilio polytes]